MIAQAGMHSMAKNAAYRDSIQTKQVFSPLLFGLAIFSILVLKVTATRPGAHQWILMRGRELPGSPHPTP